MYDSYVLSPKRLLLFSYELITQLIRGSSRKSFSHATRVYYDWFRFEQKAQKGIVNRFVIESLDLS